MSEETEEERIKKEKLIIGIDRTPETKALNDEITNLKTELESKNAIIEQQALDEFERVKAELSKAYPKEKDVIDLIQKPSDLETIKQKLKEKYYREPSGKAVNYYPTGTEQTYENQAQMLDELYKTAYYDPKASSEDKKEAKKKIEQLLTSMIESPSWKDLKEHGTKKIEQHKLSQCAVCGSTIIDGNECPICHYNPKEKQKSMKTRVYGSEKRD